MKSWHIEKRKKEEADENWEKNFKQAVETDAFDEEWEKCLFRVCYLNPRRRAKASDISNFISLLRVLILKMLILLVL